MHIFDRFFSRMCQTYFQVLGVFLTAAYMVVKGRIFLRALKLWRAAFYKLLQSTRFYVLKTMRKVVKNLKGEADFVNGFIRLPLGYSLSHY